MARRTLHVVNLSSLFYLEGKGPKNIEALESRLGHAVKVALDEAIQGFELPGGESLEISWLADAVEIHVKIEDHD
jgi:hypothetical protein